MAQQGIAVDRWDNKRRVGKAFGEIVDQAARPPARDTLAWYRLACFLPEQLPGLANLAQDGASRARAAQDYRFIVEQLGSCPRTLGATPLAAR